MNERSIFLEALDKEDPAQRSAFLDTACAGDHSLRHRVEALLKFHLEAGSFLGKLAPQRVAEELAFQQTADETQGESSAGGPANEDLGFLTPIDKPGVLGRLGYYEVQEVIGKGGMGIVLRALDEKLHRVVAIKVMAPQLATSATARKRFVREAQATAAVRNDHVIAIYAVEESNDPPFLVMEYVNGVSLQERLERSGPPDLPEILRIGMQIAAGLAAAHAQGLIHRDVKPANILLENGVERVKITDFGLARAVDDASLTQSGVVAGTPQYMAPEQARGEPVDHRADLFSLGSVLYAMCTGRAPFRASGSMAVLKRVCEEMPSPIRENRPEAPEWLAEIIARLHEKSPADRFQSAAEVAELLSQHLAHLQQPGLVPMPTLSPSPIRVRGASGEGTWVRSRRWLVAAGVIVIFLGGLGMTEATGVTNFQATVIRILTRDGTLIVETDDDAVKVSIEGDGGIAITGAGPQEVRLRPGSYRLLATKDGKPVRDELVRITRGDKQVVKVSLQTTAQAKAASQGQSLAPHEIRRFEHGGPVVQVAISPDGQFALVAGTDTDVWLIDLAGKAKTRFFHGHTHSVMAVAFSPDGRKALSGGLDATVRLWDVQSGKEIHRFKGIAETVWCVAFSPDGRKAVSAGGLDHKGGQRIWPKECPVYLWDIETGRELRRFTGHTGYVLRVAFTPDGRQVLFGGLDTAVRLWDVDTGKETRRFEGLVLGVQGVAISSAGTQILTGSADRTVRLWDRRTGELLGRFLGHRSDVPSVAFSPDGRYCVSGSWDRSVRLWDVASGKELHRFEGHTWSIRDVAFLPDGRHVLSGAEDGTVRLWGVPELEK